MSKTIDEKIVEMKFDNSNFEKNVAKTMSTLDDLKWNLGKLDCKGTADGLKDIGKAADNLKMDGLTGALETVRVKFSALQVMGITALQNLTNAAMNAGSKIASSLIDPLVNGGKNRALNIQNAKFQIEGLLGSKEYKKQWSRIDESINWAVKDTAYGYDSAARAASQFMASNVKVGKQMDYSLRAISGVAAMTNSSYDDIANVFTRVAGQGRVMAIDLNSLAARGMNAAAVLAKHFGKTETQIRDMVSKGKISFNDFALAMDNAFGEHAKKGNETFEGALSNMKAAMSRIGAKVWDPLLTNERDIFNQMRLLINDLNNNYLDEPIKKMNKKLTKALQNVVKFFEMGGTKNIILGIGDIFNYISSIIKPIKKAFREIFPKKSVETLVKYTEKFKEFTGNLKLSNDAASKIKTTFRGLFSIIDLGIKGAKALFDIVTNLASKFDFLPGKILGATSALGQWCTKTSESVKQTNFFQNIVDGTIKVVGNFGKKCKDFLKNLDIFNGLVAFFKGVFKMIGQVIKDVGHLLGEAIQTGNYKKFFEFINTLLTTGIIYNLKQCAASADKFFEAFNKGGILNNIGGALKALRGDLYQMQFVIKAKAIMEIAKALLVLAGACFVLALIKPEKLGSALTALTVGLTELMIAITIISKLLTTNLKGVISAFSVVYALQGLSKALLVTAIGLKILSTMDWDGVKISLTAMGGALLELMSALLIMGAIGKHTFKSGFSMMPAALALLAVAGVLKILATMSWDDIRRSLTAMGTALAELSISLMLLGNFGGKSFKASISLLPAVIALVALTGVLKILATMSWDDIKKSLTAMGIALGELAIALTILGRFGGSHLRTGAEIFIVTMSLLPLASVMKQLAKMDWDDMKKSLIGMGVALAELTACLVILQHAGGLKGAGALNMATGSLISIALTLKLIGSMDPWAIVAALSALAGTFVILGVAAAVLGPLAPSLFAIAGAIALLGVGAAAFGVGVTLIATGIAALAAALAGGVTVIVAGLTGIILGVAELVPQLIEIFGKTIGTICKVIVTYAPMIAETILTVIHEVLNSLVTHGPEITALLFQFMIGVLKELKNYIPDFIVGILEVFESIGEGLMRALKELNPDAILPAVAAIAGLTAIMYALSALGPLVPQAALGVLGLGALIAELALVLAAIGGLAQIPGLKWLVAEGGNFMQAVGMAIGQFIGGIAGGIALGASAALPVIGKNLSEFMENITQFIDGCRVIDGSVLSGASILAASIIMMGEAEIIKGVADLITFGHSLSDIGTQLTDFMENAQGFIDGVRQIDPGILSGVSALAKAIILLTAADMTQGIAKFITFGQRGDLGKFGSQLPPLAESISSFVDNLGNFGEDKVAVAKAAADVLVAISESATKIPNSGGIGSWFSGDNDIGKFGDKLPGVGEHIGKFVESLGTFGEGQVATVNAACNALIALAESADKIPNSGGIGSWFAGDNDIGKFGDKLPGVGTHLKEFSNNLGEFGDSQIKTVDCAGKAIKLLAQSASEIPNTGGVGSWFAGDNDIGKFGDKLPGVGKNLADFVTNLGMFSDGQIKTVDAAGRAIKALASSANEVPDTGGLGSWFAGDNDIGKFGDKLPGIGKNLADFVTNLGTFNDTQIKTVDAAGNAIKALASAANEIPNTGGLVSWFAGDNDISKFSDKFGGIGTHLADFVTNLGVFGDDQIKTVDAAGNAIKALASSANEIPNTGGLVSLFSGDNDISKFASKFGDVGSGLNSFIKAIGTFGKDQVATVTCAVDALRNIVTLAQTASWDDKAPDKLRNITYIFWDVGNGIANFVNAQKDISTEDVKTAAKKLKTIVDSVDLISKLKSDNLVNFKNCLKQIADDGVKSFYESIIVEDALSKSRTAAQKFIKEFINSAEKMRIDVQNKFKEVAKEAYNGLNDSNVITNVTNLGKNFVQGFANGINNNIYLARNAGSAVGNAALDAAKRSIDAHSPSRETFALGKFFDQGMVNGIIKYATNVYSAAKGVGEKAKNGLTSAISRITDVINSDMDTSPVIRPVLDISGVQNGVGALNSMFGRPSMAVAANIGAISSNFRGRNQNGNYEVVSAIDKLRKDMNNVRGDTYMIDGITYDDGSNVSEAVETLVRAARIERRR